MSLKSRAAEIFGALILLALLGASFRIGESRDQRGGLSLLMEPDGTGVWHRFVDEFNRRYPDVPVHLVEGPQATNTREDMYATSFLAGAGGYDIVYCDVVWVPKFAAAGWLLDLTDRLSPEERQDFLRADVEAGTYHGRLYRIPAFTDAGLLYYRTDLVPHPPETFEELFKDASENERPGRSGFVWQGKQYEGLVTNFLEVLWGYGGDWITDDRKVLLDAPEAIEALRFMVKTVGTISPPGVTTYAEEDTRSVFEAGRAVFLRNWLYVAGMIDQSNSEVKGKVAFVPMVHEKGPRSATLGGWGFAVSKNTAYPEAAWNFVKFVTSPEQLLTLLRTSGRIPARRSLVPEQFQDLLDHARFRPRIPEYAQASDILQRWVSAALSRSASPEEAMKSAAHETRQLLGGS